MDNLLNKKATVELAIRGMNLDKKVKAENWTDWDETILGLMNDLLELLECISEEEIMDVKFKKLSESATAPTRGSEYAAGWDLYLDNAEEVVIQPGETKLMPTNIAVEIPEGCFGAIYARSGLATKQGLRPANCVGVIDEDYRGGIGVGLHNDTNTPQKIFSV